MKQDNWDGRLKAKVAAVALCVVALYVLCVVAAVHAEVGGNNSISVTSTATTTTLSNGVSTVCFISDSASTHKYFARLFTTADTPAAATTSSPIRIEIGASKCFTHNPRWETGGGYIGYSLITTAAETATARVLSK